jgi:iron complex outermembrane receptor protein
LKHSLSRQQLRVAARCRHPHRTPVGLAVIALCGVATPAWSQTASTTAQRVEVTGSGRADDFSVSTGALRAPIPVDQTPQSVLVLPRSLLDEQGVRTLTEALGNAASVRGTDARDQLNFGLRIRGFEAGVLVDGVALPGTFTTPDLLAGVSRIDVVKGPVGTLYGGAQAAGNGGFIGGLVALTTAAPQPTFSASASARAGTQAQAGLAADINVPLGPTVAARLQAETSREDSETDRIRHKRLAVQPSLAWRPGRDTDVVLRWRHTESRGLDYSGLPRKGTIEPAEYEVPRSRIITAESTPESTTELDAVNLQWTQQLSEAWSLQVTLAHVDARYDQRGTFPLDSVTFGWPAVSEFDGPFYTVVGARLWNQQQSTVLSPSLTGRLEALGAKHTLSAGLDLDRTRDDAYLVFAPNFGVLGPIDIRQPAYPAWNEPVAPAVPDQQNRYRSTGVYVQDHADFGGFQLLASVRHSTVRVTDVNPAFFVDNDTRNTRTLGRVGGVLQLAPGVSAFAGWGQGMRVPTGAVFTEPPKPELSDQTELGLRLDDWHGVSATLAWFDLSLRNGLQADPVNVGQTLQVGEETSRGVDLDLVWQLAAGTRLLGSWSHIDTEVVDTGKRFVDLPDTTARVALRHDFAGSSALSGLGLGLGFTYHSALAGDADNSFETPSATVWDAQLSYRSGAFLFGVVARNLADKAYFVPSRYFGGGQVTPAPERSVALTVQWSL